MFFFFLNLMHSGLKIKLRGKLQVFGSFFFLSLNMFHVKFRFNKNAFARLS